MHALINAFLRCLSFLLPPSWLQLAFCWWVGDECGKMPWPNPRARFKRKKPLTYQEVTPQDDSIPFASPAPSCVSLAANSSAPPPQGSPWGRIRELWQAVERIFGAPFATHQRWSQKPLVFRSPYPVVAFDSNGNSFSSQGGTAFATEADVLTGDAFISGSMSTTMELPAQSVSDLVGQTVNEEVITVDQHLSEMGTQVTITVAIQAAEDEELEADEELSANHLDIHGGSGSEDEIGRHDKSR